MILVLLETQNILLMSTENECLKNEIILLKDLLKAKNKIIELLEEDKKNLEMKLSHLEDKFSGSNKRTA